MKGGYFLYDGQFCKEGEAVFTLADISSRATGFTEFFRAENNEILFRESVARHLSATADTLGIDFSEWIGAEGKLLGRDVSRLLNKNKIYLAAKICLQAFNSGGQTHILISCEEMERGFFPIREPGLLLSIYRDHRKGSESDFSYAPFGYFVQQSAGRFATAINQPNLIILNSEGYACESIGGSFAYIVSDSVYFPGPGSGGYLCSLREEVVKCVRETGFIPVDCDTIECADLLNAEEVFLFDACNGIQKVLGLEDQRYFSTKTAKIAERLTAMAIHDRSQKN
jgi:branched-subunit amino acid aminotransferase/4-amino-4-deoxychorismate lyase